jgi:hypothetical protein
MGDFDFLDADRKARAKVHLLKIDLRKEGRYNSREEAQDPFEIWFENNFKIEAEKDESDSWSSREDRRRKEKEERQEKIQGELTTGRNLTQVLVSLYQADLSKLIKTYEKLSEIDAELMKELGVKTDKVRAALREKIENLKSLYWHEIFERMQEIKSRLCSEERSRILAKLVHSTSIDFTESNIYAILLWVIKNANKYFGDQIVRVYKQLSERENIKNYKSNQTTWEKDHWRYREQEKSKYTLDYRLIYSRGGWEGYGDKRLSNSSIYLIDDLMTIAENLGFDGQNSKSFSWDQSPSYGEKQEFYMRPNWRNDNSVKNLLFMQARFYKNGNIHLKLNQDFMKAFNVEAGRILGWIKSPVEAANEFSEDCKVTEGEAGKYFKKNLLLMYSNASNLLESSI